MGETVYQPVSATDAHDADLKLETSEPFTSSPQPPTRPFRRLLSSRDLLSKRALLSYARHLLPSFLQRQPATKPRPGGPGGFNIDSLDGLRGLACLCVVNQHFTQAFTRRLFWNGWGQSPDDYWLAEAPFIKVFWAGSAQVFTFFVLSGYVLSVKPIRCMLNGQTAKLHQALASAILRRGIRLWLPVLFVCAVAICMAQMGAYNPAIRAQMAGFIADPEQILPQEASMSLQILKLRLSFWRMTDWFDWGWDVAPRGPWLNQHLWSIVVEWRASMMLFMVHTGTSRLRPLARIAIVCMLLVYCGSSQQQCIYPFWVGMLLAEVDQHYQRWQTSTDFEALPVFLQPHQRHLPKALEGFPRHFRPDAPFFRGLMIAFFVFGLWCASCPHQGSDIGGNFWPSSKIMPSWFITPVLGYWIWTMGAAFLVCSAVHSPDLRIIYCNRFARYAGKISFAVYIVHGFIIRSAIYGSLPHLALITGPLGGRATQIGFFVQWILGACILWPLVFWAADLVSRFVDTPTVRLAKWLEDVCSKEMEG